MASRVSVYPPSDWLHSTLRVDSIPQTSCGFHPRLSAWFYEFVIWTQNFVLGRGFFLCIKLISDISLTLIVRCANWLWICCLSIGYDKQRKIPQAVCTSHVVPLRARPFVCQKLSPVPARLCFFALGGLHFGKTIINCFVLVHPVRGAQTKSAFERRRIFVCIIHFSLFIIHYSFSLCGLWMNNEEWSRFADE